MALIEAWNRLCEKLSVRKQSYLELYRPECGAMIEDLKKFCRADETIWDENSSKRDVLIGRREVWLRIADHLTKTPQELAAMYGQPKPEPEDGRYAPDYTDEYFPTTGFTTLASPGPGPRT